MRMGIAGERFGLRFRASLKASARDVSAVTHYRIIFDGFTLIFDGEVLVLGK